VLYKETVMGKKLKVNRPRVNRRLNAVLEQSLMAWQNNRQMKDEQQLVVKR
jgi:AraC-like DNA-binding protein